MVEEEGCASAAVVKLDCLVSGIRIFRQRILLNNLLSAPLLLVLDFDHPHFGNTYKSLEDLGSFELSIINITP